MNMTTGESRFVVEDDTTRTTWSIGAPQGLLISEYLQLTALVDRLDDLPLDLPLHHQRFFELMVENFAQLGTQEQL